jgi:hypothetical protein
MPRKSSYARISITLPKDILASADREAKKLDRPRSWVVAEAIRAYAAGGRQSSVPPPGASEVAAARREHLIADMRLSPQERLHRADALLTLAPRSGAGRRAQIIGFSSYEDFARWKQNHQIENAIQS